MAKLRGDAHCSKLNGQAVPQAGAGGKNSRFTRLLLGFWFNRVEETAIDLSLVLILAFDFVVPLKLWPVSVTESYDFCFGFWIAGAVVWCLMGVLCVYAMFLIALSTIALSVLLALGPLFVAMLFFEATKRFFAAWIAQLANYALITVLTVMVAALLLQVVQSYAAQTAARGAAIVTVDALHMVLIAVLVFLVLRQVMPTAAWWKTPGRPRKIASKT